MVQIIKENRPIKPSVARSLLGGLAEGGVSAFEQYQKRKAYRDLGIPEGIPDELAKVYLAEQLKGQMPLSPLDQSKLNLNQAKMGQIESEQNRFNQLLGGQNSTNTSDQQGGANINQKMEDMPEDQLRGLAAFAGQPGESGIYGNQAKSILDRRKDEEKNKFDKYKFGYEHNKDYMNQVTDSYQGAEEMDMRLEQLLSLTDLPTPVMATTLEALGLPPSLYSADAETADKLSIDLTKNIQQFYGSRILQSEFSAFLRSIPNLKNTPEGKKRIIRNMQIFNRLKRLEYEKMRSKELDAEAMEKPLTPSFRRDVLDSMKKEANEIGEEFKEANEKYKPLKRMKVKKGTPISDEMIDKYIIDTKGNVSLAEKNAREDGYEF